MHAITNFNPWLSLLGGVAIGLGASLLLIGAGRVAGISGIAGNLVLGTARDRAWRVAFVFGLLAAGSLSALLAPSLVQASPRSLFVVSTAGLLVGLGTRLGSGCTSGHGVCGVSRLSPRSLLATLTFMVTGATTVAVVRWLGGTS